MNLRINMPLNFCVLLLICVNALADTPHDLAPYKGSKALERIKELAGEWKGTVTHLDGKKEDVSATYTVTSNGSAVIETIFKGTPMEMTSVYFDQDGKLAMTHYCAVANRPKLSLVKESDNLISLSYSSGDGLDPKKDMHIHALDLEIKGEGSIIQTWLGYEGGKKSHTTVLRLNKSAG